MATGVLRELLRRHPEVEEVHALVRYLAPQQQELWGWMGRLGFKETEVADVDLPEAPRRGGPDEAQKYIVVKAADLRDRLGEEAEPWEVEVETIVTDRCRMRGGEAHEKAAVRLMQRHHAKGRGGDGRPMAERVPEAGRACNVYAMWRGEGDGGAGWAKERIRRQLTRWERLAVATSAAAVAEEAVVVAAVASVVAERRAAGLAV